MDKSLRNVQLYRIFLINLCLIAFRVIIDVLRQAAKSCIMKRQLQKASLLIRQAMSLADELYSVDQHPRYADTLIDYGFFLLNFDCVRESVKMYEKALNIRKKVFGKNNLLVAMVYEDLAYAQYVKEYNSGNFYQPRFVFYVVLYEKQHVFIKFLRREIKNKHFVHCTTSRTLISIYRVHFPETTPKDRYASWKS